MSKLYKDLDEIIDFVTMPDGDISELSDLDF